MNDRARDLARARRERYRRAHPARIAKARRRYAKTHRKIEAARQARHRARAGARASGHARASIPDDRNAPTTIEATWAASVPRPVPWQVFKALFGWFSYRGGIHWVDLTVGIRAGPVLALRCPICRTRAKWNAHRVGGRAVWPNGEITVDGLVICRNPTCGWTVTIRDGQAVDYIEAPTAEALQPARRTKPGFCLRGHRRPSGKTCPTCRREQATASAIRLRGR